MENKETEKKHELEKSPDYGQHVHLHSEFHLMESTEKLLDGKTVVTYMLAQNGVPKFCHLLNPLLISSHLAGSKPTAWRPPCNNRCSQFKIVKRMDKISETESVENHYVQLSCGAGILHLLRRDAPAKEETTLKLEK